MLKQSARWDLLQAIRAAAAAGGQYLDSTLTARVTALVLGRANKPSRAVALSDREADVLRLIASGYSNKEIAGSFSERQDHRSAQGERHERPKLGLTGRIGIVDTPCCRAGSTSPQGSPLLPLTVFPIAFLAQVHHSLLKT